MLYLKSLNPFFSGEDVIIILNEIYTQNHIIDVMVPSKPDIIEVNENNDMLKKYELHFDVWGLLLFLIVMAPNFIWFAIPAPNDILRSNSITETIDIAASVCQVLMIAALCFIRNRESKKLRKSSFLIIAAIFYLLYIASWIAYYGNIVNVIVILGLTVPPCLTFLFYAIDRKNWIALIPITIFTICHLIHGVENFII
ncbi:MAG: hypothetical protein ACOXZM_08105 [Eubacteriales bacterium]